MKEHQVILHKVGWVLITGGFVDILVMIYCITHEMSYSSCFNIFAVVAGIFLLRNNLNAARIISFFAAFFIAGCGGSLFILPFFFPFGLLLAYTRSSPTTVIVDLLLVIIIMALVVWIYRQLTQKVVRSAMEEFGQTAFWRKPTSGFWLGGCLVVVMLVFMSFMMGGTTAKEAKQRAAEQVGQGYKFVVTSLNMSSSARGKHVYAVVVAYNDAETTNVVLEWSE